MRKWIRLFLMLPLLLTVGCSDDDGTPTNGGKPDTTPPGITGVAALDANHLQVTFSEPVTKATAERTENYLILETNPTPVAGRQTAAPGDTIHIFGAVLGSDDETVTITTLDLMDNLPYELTVTGVEDLSGNKITDPVSAGFTGSNASDTTPPEIASRTPGPDATGVGLSQSVIVEFSEAMNSISVEQAFHWSWSSGLVPWEMEIENANTFVFRPLAALLSSTVYTASVNGTAQDIAGNALSGAPVTWNFTTTSQIDDKPPTLVLSVPHDGETNVPVSTNLELTFSEAIDQNSLDNIIVSPDVGTGVVVISEGGSQVTFDPDVDLMDDTQYSLTIVPGSVRDLAGNGTEGVIQVSWTTGASLATGSFSGVISGDPTSTYASDPAGAVVIAADANPFGPSDDFGIAGIGVVSSIGSYSVNNLPDGWYFPVAAMDSNGDGEIDPSHGDAIGAYGITFPIDFTPDSVQIVGGNMVTGVNFALIDPVAISGHVDYSGLMTGQYSFFVGVFDTTGLDLGSLPDPDFGTQGFWPFDPSYSVEELDEGLVPGTYYVGAYLDVNFDQMFDPNVDPAGFYGGITPTPITLADGQDALDIDIVMLDPFIPAAPSSAAAWRVTASSRNAWPSKMAARIRRLLGQLE